MSRLVDPHGGEELKPLLLEGAAREEELKRAESMPKIPVSSREAGDLFMLGMGGFTPLDGFMTHADWESVCDGMHTAKGTFWPIPITLSVDKERADQLSDGDEVALQDPERDEILATMKITDKYAIDKKHEAMMVYQTTDADEHPGVKMVMEQGDYNLAGPVKVLSLGGFPETYGDLFMTPAETRKAFQAKGWSKVAAFQTRNPMHRSHEHLVKLALDTTADGVLVHSLLGKLKPGDVPAEYRTRAISTLIDKYFVSDTVIQAGYPLDMRYAGPREALLHAVFRQNYGCSHLIVGRDHAGVGDYYGSFDAQAIFDEIPEDALQIEPLKMDLTFWCNTCVAMATNRTCPHGEEERMLLSGTKLRKYLSEGQEVPPNFSRPEVLEILREHFAG